MFETRRLREGYFCRIGNYLTIPLEIWLTMIKYRQPQGVLHYASTFRDWHKPLTNQIVWQEAYNAILPEYANRPFLYHRLN
jgi:hypothetical protein